MKTIPLPEYVYKVQNSTDYAVHIEDINKLHTIPQYSNKLLPLQGDVSFKSFTKKDFIISLYKILPNEDFPERREIWIRTKK